jgi:hypothetical protein
MPLSMLSTARGSSRISPGLSLVRGGIGSGGNDFTSISGEDGRDAGVLRAGFSSATRIGSGGGGLSLGAGKASASPLASGAGDGSSGVKPGGRSTWSNAGQPAT